MPYCRAEDLGYSLLKRDGIKLCCGALEFRSAPAIARESGCASAVCVLSRERSQYAVGAQVSEQCL